MHSAVHLSPVEEAIRTAGGRATYARLRILELIQGAAAPVSHADIESQLQQGMRAVDRVTIYRVLDWLVEVGLALKAADAHGVFRFSATQPQGEHDRHAHLRCTGCGGMFCLETLKLTPPELPGGFRFAGMDIDIRGECPGCVETHTVTPA